MKETTVFKFLGSLLLAILLSTLLTSFTAFAAIRENHTTIPQKNACNQGYVFDHVSSIPTQTFVSYDVVHTVHNRTGSAETFVLTASVSTTVKLSVSGNLGVNLESVNLGAGVTLEASATATASASVSMSVPSGKYGHGQYGVFQREFYGHYYYRNLDCSASPDYGYIDVTGPTGTGWDTWVNTSP